MRLLLVEAVVVGALAALCSGAWAADAQSGAAAAAPTPVISSVGTPSAASPPAQVPRPGVWTVLTPVRPSSPAKQDSPAHPAAAIEVPPNAASGAAATAPTAPAYPSAASPTIAAISPPSPLPQATSHQSASGTPPTANQPAANQPSAPAVATSAPVPSAEKNAVPHPTPGQIALSKTTDPSVVRNPLNWSVMVYKSRHLLVVYFEGHLYKKYRAVFGRSLELGTKEWAGDRRTPEGVYRIIGKRPDRRWRYFLKLNYPNNWDRRMYDAMLADGAVPRIHGRATPEGGEIGIHGTDEPMLNAGDINWTTGCISVGNGAIDELDTLLPVGTLVIIKR